ncbi:MAG TPA: hydroxymethylbilane synthase [Vicinamibacterales bacterium]
MPTLKLGTRGSQLALIQANVVAALLGARAGVSCDVVVIKTSGDRLADAPLAQIGGKRLFVKEIEDALRAGLIDLAVHSSKDMPAVLPDGLALGAALPREDARDAIVLPAASVPGPHGSPSVWAPDDIVRRLGEAPTIGTSSVRRTAQLLPLFPRARFGAIRGNLDTRLRKLDSGEFHAIVLAAAGLRRLGQEARISVALPPNICVPAPGQGIIAVEVRSDDTRVRTVVERINDPGSAAALAAERMVVRRLGGGCQMPIGAHATVSSTELSLMTIVASIDGRRALRAEASGAVSEAESIGTRAAMRLLAQGAAEILAEADTARGAVEGLQP